MGAKLLLRERRVITATEFADLVVWQLPAPLPASGHSFKYRLAFVVNGNCVVRYDNESGKGDHKHIGKKQLPYVFAAPAQLIADFWNDVDRWRQ